MTPKVGVCIPTHNAAPFIEKTIESVLNQTLRDIEVIVIDDASTDDTLEVIRRFNDSRLRVDAMPVRSGLAGAWNRAIASANANVVKLLCHDDLLKPQCLERQAEALDDPAVALVSCWREVVDVQGRRLLTRRGMSTSPAGADRLDVLRAVVRAGTNMIGEPSATMFRKQDWDRARGFSDANPYMIDIDLWMRLLRFGRLRMIPEVQCAFRVTQSALSTKLANRQYRLSQEFIESLAGEPGSSVSFLDQLMGRVRSRVRSWGRRLLYARLRAE